MHNTIDFVNLSALLKAGEIIAYPTEGVFGLGCDPLNEIAVEKLLKLKQRSIEKGLIVIAANWQQLEDWIGDMPHGRLQAIQTSSDHPITWLVPASNKVPTWIRGEHTSVAMRVTQHTIAREMCLSFGEPIVSTSANISNQPPCMNYHEACKQFADNVAYIIDAPTGGFKKPSEIRDALSGAIIRP